ncbi:MAG: hypothetical protein JXM73_08105 [Anaerolineae bacterium]|nr:hypothetical protein [Anaerolineae bacterium]
MKWSALSGQIVLFVKALATSHVEIHIQVSAVDLNGPQPLVVKVGSVGAIVLHDLGA